MAFMKIAIIGAGIAGMGAAYLLAPKYDITLYEKNGYIGGHSRTINITTENKKTPVDTGFIVFNNWNYPNLLGLFKELKVPYQKSDMSFGISIDNSWLEYGSDHMFALRNMVRPAYWGMIKDILRFNKQSLAYIEKDPEITLSQCMNELKMGYWFRHYYLLAMGASIWSCPIEMVMQFPAQTFLRFFKNHGLLNINDRPQWYTVTGGSKEYVKRLTAQIEGRIKINCGAQKVSQHNDKVTVTDAQGKADTYDHVIFGCHADDALAMIENPSAEEKNILGAFSYQENKIIVHHDTSFMPQNKKFWASWVYLSEDREDKNKTVSLSYWMNNLQNLDTETPVLVTLNPGRRPNEEMIFDEHSFSHPIFDLKAIKAQTQIDTIQGQRGLWFCGAYQRYGFHEDGLVSAVNVAKKLGVSIPWE